MTKVYNVIAEVHKPLPHGGYRVKVSLPDLGMYINGMVVFPPNEDKPAWYVQPPSKLAGRGKWVGIVEFNKKHILWDEVYDACAKSVELYMHEDDQATKDVVLKDIDDTPIDFSSIPF
jgi:hypothetical protein